MSLVENEMNVKNLDEHDTIEFDNDIDDIAVSENDIQFDSNEIEISGIEYTVTTSVDNSNGEGLLTI